jgi:hypothetical protein
MSEPNVHRLQGMPGIDGGGLGLCSVCGQRFTVQILMSMSGCNRPKDKILEIEIPGFGGTFAVHKPCVDALNGMRGRPWTWLPVGPIRRGFEQAEREGTLVDA